MQCKECKFFFKADSLSPEGNVVGECKRFPRLSVLEDGEQKWRYPLQFESDLCGEFLRLS